MSGKTKLYLGLTATNNTNWRDKIQEIKELQLEEIALFPTPLEFDARQELHRALEETPIKHIPFVHLRSDSTPEEIEYYRKRFKTQYFNIHADSYRNFLTEPGLKEDCFIENTDYLPEPFFEALKYFAGICVDFAHLEDYGFMQKEPTYENFIEVLEKTPIGLAHIGPVLKKSYFRHYSYFSRHDYHHASHTLENLSDFDYLKKYRRYFPEIMALEIDNPLRVQLEAKKYIEKEILR